MPHSPCQVSTRIQGVREPLLKLKALSAFHVSACSYAAISQELGDKNIITPAYLKIYIFNEDIQSVVSILSECFN